MESGGEKKMVCVRKSVMIDFKCGARGIGVGVAPCEICVRRPGAPEFCKLRLGPDIGVQKLVVVVLVTAPKFHQGRASECAAALRLVSIQNARSRARWRRCWAGNRLVRHVQNFRIATSQLSFNTALWHLCINERLGAE